MSNIDKENEYLLEDTTNLEGIQNPEGEDDLPFNKELLLAVLEKDYVRDAFMSVWKNVQNNKAFRKADKAKN